MKETDERVPEEQGHGGEPGPEPSGSLETTARLLDLVRSGDDAARERLVARALPLLKRWARGRLPNRARGMVDTDDLVQLALLRALNNVDAFDPRREGAFLAYLRRILLNAIRDELRRVTRRPPGDELPESLADDGPSAVEEAIGRETMERYEAALSTLPERAQEAVILRVELDYSFQQVADAIGAPSANAARMTVARALVRLAEAMGHGRR